jgi:hypothetical protein
MPLNNIMSKPTIVVATQRVGGTAYAKMLSQELGYEFINEPWSMSIFADTLKKNFNVSGEGIRHDVPAGNCVIHTISGHFLTHFGNKFPDADYIFMKRRDTWAQLMSFIIMRHNLKNFGLHNIDIKHRVQFEVNMVFVQLLFYEWTMFDLLLEKFQNPKVVYYEDVDFSKDLPFKKNQGYENLTILNLDNVKEQYDIFWKNRS